jgi:hypothetical protein
MPDIDRKSPAISQSCKKIALFMFDVMSKERTSRPPAANDPALLLDRPPLVRDSSGTGLNHGLKQEGTMTNEKKIVTSQASVFQIGTLPQSGDNSKRSMNGVLL